MKSLVVLIFVTACVQMNRYPNASRDHVLACRAEAKDVMLLNQQPVFYINARWYNNCMESLGYSTTYKPSSKELQNDPYP